MAGRCVEIADEKQSIGGLRSGQAEETGEDGKTGDDRQKTTPEIGPCPE